MSTSYYGLAPPITFLKLDSGKGGHDRLSIWVNHGLAGTLTLREEETRDILIRFTGPECLLHVYYGSPDTGAVVAVFSPDLPDEAVMISEYGELTTVAQVKAQCGVGKRSGENPTDR